MTGELSSRVFDPQDPIPPEQDLCDRLVSQGASRSIAQLIADVVAEPDILTGDIEHRCRFALRSLTLPRHDSESGTIETCCAIWRSTPGDIIGTDERRKCGPTAQQRLFEIFKRYRLELSTEFPACATRLPEQIELDETRRDFIRQCVFQGLVDVGDAIDVRLLCEHHDREDGRRLDARRVLYWLDPFHWINKWVPHPSDPCMDEWAATVVRAVARWIRLQSDHSTRVRMCLGLWREIGWWMLIWGLHPRNPWELGYLLNGELQQLYESTVRDALEHGSTLQPDEQWFLLKAWTVFSGTDRPAPLDCNGLRSEASKVLGMLRSKLKNGDVDAFRSELPVFQDAMYTLAYFPKNREDASDIWCVLSPLLQGMRALNSPCVASDLRWWTVPDLDDREESREWQNWMAIPAAFCGWLHVLAEREERMDGELEMLRRDFSQFCLERLKPKKFEDNPIWRLAYVCAVEDLDVNPYGRGHTTLEKTADHDSDSQVRKRARRAATKIRRSRSDEPAMNPRGMVLLAFWRLRQAHRFALGLSVDPSGANRTRDQEVRRTTQSHDQNREGG